MNLHTRAFAACRELTRFYGEIEKGVHPVSAPLDYKRLGKDIYALARGYNNLRWALNGQKLIVAAEKKKRAKKKKARK